MWVDNNTNTEGFYIESNYFDKGFCKAMTAIKFTCPLYRKTYCLSKNICVLDFPFPPKIHSLATKVIK